MKIYVNSNNEILDVYATTNESLAEIEINDETNPFKDWSTAKICCFKVEVKDGEVVMFTPYVNSNLIGHIDRLGNKGEQNEGDIINTQLVLTDMYEAMFDNEVAMFALNIDNPIVKVYANLVAKGFKTLDEIPDSVKESVIQLNN